MYKEKGYTSHDVVAIMRKLLGMKRIGHGGTLDPEAEGVLVIMLGKSARLSDMVMSGKKVYTAGVKFGVQTDTQDIFGEIINERPINFSKEKLESLIPEFTGNINQIPPMYSAIKVNGQKLYNLARKGKEVDRAPRAVFIDKIELLDFKEPDEALIKVTCSKGVYIRTLINDIGEALGCGAAMSSLVRNSSGRFADSNAFKIDELRKLAESGEINKAIMPADAFFVSEPKAIVTNDIMKKVKNGNSIHSIHTTLSPDITHGRVLLYDSYENFIGTYNLEQNLLKPEIIFMSL